MQPFYVIDKARGETPLQALARLRAEVPALARVPLTYAGRLDPMATGALLVLAGDECKRQDRYRNLDKEYEVEVLLGAKTDTGDLLGLPALHPSRPDLSLLKEALRNELGTKRVPYPRFSSKTVDGTPLFMHALGNTLTEENLPTHEETIYRIAHLGSRTASSRELRDEIAHALRWVPRADEPSKTPGADFRQDEVRAAWATALEAERAFTLVRLRVTARSGTYMRSLAERIGSALGTYGCAYSIHRTRIGRYARFPGIWLKAYR